MELSKVVPPPNNYDVKRNIDIKAINPRQPCLFGHTYESYRKTADFEPGLKVFNHTANKTNAGDYFPEVTQNKKRVPAFSQSKAKQFVLWEEECKKAERTPGPCSYEND